LTVIVITSLPSSIVLATHTQDTHCKLVPLKLSSVISASLQVLDRKNEELEDSRADYRLQLQRLETLVKRHERRGKEEGLSVGVAAWFFNHRSTAGKRVQTPSRAEGETIFRVEEFQSISQAKCSG